MIQASLVRFRRTAALVLAAAGLAAAGCGSKAAGKERHTQAAPPETARPTPDTTPVEALRTPAGLILKPGEAPSVVTATPATPTPAPPAKPAS